MNLKNRKILIILTIGSLFGVLSALGDSQPFNSLFFVFAGFINTASVWCISSFLIGRHFRSRLYSMLASVSFLTFSIFFYYLTGILKSGDFSQLALLIFTAISWVFIAIFLGSLCGLAGRSSRYSKDIKKRMLSTIIPIVIVVSESVISILQLLPLVNSNANTYIPLSLLICLCLIAILLPYVVFRNRLIAFYTAVLAVIMSAVGVTILILLGNIR
jgi:hypothetical protein